MTEKFDASPEGLHAPAAAFNQQASEIAAAIPGFCSAAYDVHGASGALGPSKDILRAYLDTTGESLRGLEGLARRLAGDATRLRASGGNPTGAGGAARQGLRGWLRL